MRFKAFGSQVHIGLLLQWLIETAIAMGGCWAPCMWLSGPMQTGWGCLVQSLVFAATAMVSLATMGLYSRRQRDRFAGLALRITVAIGFAMLLFGLWLIYIAVNHMTLSQVLAAAGITWLGLVLSRRLTQPMVEQDVFKRRVLVYGCGSNAAKVLQLRRRADRRGFRVIGYVQAGTDPMVVPATLILDAGQSLHDLARSLQVDEIVVAMDDRRQQFPFRQLLQCRLAGIEIIELVSFLERETGKVYLDIVSPSWMIFSAGFRQDIWWRYTERAFDLVVSTLLLLLALPFMLLTAVAIKFDDGVRAPIFYGQPRVGYAGRIIRVLKFRSMSVDAEQDGKAVWAAANDSRVTRVGRFIRKVRIDELPQLWNVFAGHMSFVGPRPERPEFVEQLTAKIPYFDERHSMKPGITGWAQVCYPYGASEHDAMEKLQYDLYYVKNHNLWFEILILLQTVEVIVLGKGAR
jgi:sugar transferase (PEP-CTERM system associated)